MSPTTSVTLNSRQFTIFLTAFALATVLISLACQFIIYVAQHDYVYGLLPVINELFRVSGERNIPTLFSVILLSLSVALLLAVGFGARHTHSSHAWYWISLAIGFVYLAIDEGWALHEELSDYLTHLIGATHGALFYPWVIPAAIISFAVGLVYARFLLSLPRETALAFFIAGAMYVAGAVGLEMLEARHEEIVGATNLYYELLAHLEETLEMLSLIVFIRALIRYLAARHVEWVFAFTER